LTILPETVSQAWEERKGPVILTTVNEEGMPNAIYVGCVRKFSEDKLVVADNRFNKTRANILAGSKGSILFRAQDGRAYQVKGEIEYHTSGEIYDDMKSWLDDRFPGHAAAVLIVQEVYSGAEKLA
jgi:predicted pyridoxine 5'-phosphate oxidase superfamily flavin-nucleotide-binding protein